MRDNEQRKAYREANKDQINAKGRVYREANKEKILAKGKAYREANNDQLNERKRALYNASREKRKAQRRTRTYGVDESQYNEMLARQSNCCAICNTHKSELKKELSVDHNHNTGKVRGLLCHSCNLGIGLLKDSPSVVFRAHVYLIHHQEVVCT